MEFKKEDKKYLEINEELNVVFSNVYEKLLPMLSSNKEELLEYISQISLPKKQRLIKKLQTKILYSPSEIVEIRNCAIEILSIIITDDKTLKKFMDIIILFGNLWKEDKINLYDLIYNSNEYVNSEDPVLSEKIKTYILIESEFIDRVLDLKIKLPNRSTIISEFLYQSLLYFNELNNELLLECSKQKSGAEFNFNLTLNDVDSDILKWNLMDNKSKHYMNYLNENLDSTLDKTIKEILVFISRDSKYGALLLTKQYSKLIKEYLNESRAYIPYELLALITSNLIKKEVEFDYEICQILLDRIISKETKVASEQASLIIDNKSSLILIKSLANIFIGCESACEKAVNETNIVDIILEILKNGIKDNKTTKWIDEQFINLMIGVFRVVAGIKLNPSLSNIISTSGIEAALKSFNECPNKYLQQYSRFVLENLKHVPKEKLNINIENITFKSNPIEEMPIPEQVKLRTDLINASNNLLDVPQIKEGYFNITPCDGNGVVILSGYEEKDNIFNFIGLIINIFTKEINDSTLYSCSSLEDVNVYFFNHYCNLRKHWSQVSKEKAMKLINAIYTTSTIIPGKDSKKIEELLNLSKNDDQLENVYRCIDEISNETLDKKYIKSYYWWREFLGSELNNNIQFKYSDLTYNNGYIRPKYYQLKSKATTNDVPPNPDSYINYWIKMIENSSSSLFNFEPLYNRISIYLLHSLLYFKGISAEIEEIENINLDEIINILKNSYLDIYENFKNNKTLLNNTIFRVMIERTLFIEQEEELILPTELYMIFSSSRNNLILPIDGIIRKSNKLIYIENRLKNYEIKELQEMLIEIIKEMYSNNVIDIQSIYNNEKINNWIYSKITDKYIAKQFLLNTLVLLNSFVRNVKHLLLSTSFEPVEDTGIIEFGFQSNSAF